MGVICQGNTFGESREQSFSATCLVEPFLPISDISSIPLNILQVPQDLAMLSGLGLPGDPGDFAMAPLLWHHGPLFCMLFSSSYSF